MEERIYNPQFFEKDFLKSKSGIYQIRNLVNNKIYIGSSKNLYKRFQQHFNDLRRNKHENSYLQYAYNKYGLENFVFEILEFCDEDIRFIIEQYWLDRFFGKTCYNINEEANKPPNISGRKLPPTSEETKKRISKTLEEKYKQDENYRIFMHQIHKNNKGKNLGGKHKKAKQVVCLETEEVFDSLSDATRKMGGDPCQISRCCLGKSNVFNNLHWMFKQDYDKLTKQQIEDKIYSNKRPKAVVCLDTGVKYLNVKDAMKDTGSFKDSISNCCKNNIAETENGLHWAYYNDYKNMSLEDIQNKIKKHNTNYRRIVCVETGKIYAKSIDVFKEYKNSSLNNIYKICNNPFRTVFGLHWYDEETYLKLSQEEIKEIINTKYKKQGQKCCCIQTGEQFNSLAEAARNFNVSTTTIRNSCQGKQTHLQEYHFKFID